MVGGVMGGYWASGSVDREMAPARVMTMDSTAAKIGRSMKKRDMRPALLLRLLLARRRRRPALRDGRRRRDARPRRRHRHGPHVGPHLHVLADALQAVDDHLVAGRQPLLDHAQPVVQRADLHAAILHLVVVADDVDEALALV